MAETSPIEWTDATWQPITGCSVVSPGCTNCYAMKLAGGRLRHHPSRAGLTTPTKAGPVWNGKVRLNEAWLAQPIQWKRPRKIFVCAHGDPFHEDVPDPWVDQVFASMALAPQHTYQVLTKRPERMCAYIEELAGGAPTITPLSPVAHGLPRARLWAAMEALQVRRLPDLSWPLPNVWLGVSVEDQERADQRRDPMAAIAAAGWPTFVSYEPALGPVDWAGWAFLRWMISGGESGPGARPSHPDWHRAARDFCDAHAIAYLFKQWGDWYPQIAIEGEHQPIVLMDVLGRRGDAVVMDPDLDEDADPYWTSWWFERLGKKAAGRLLDGREHNDFPSPPSLERPAAGGPLA